MFQSQVSHYWDFNAFCAPVWLSREFNRLWNRSGIRPDVSVIAYEGSDCFDSTSRSFSYLFARPWRTLFYDFIAFVYGFICFLFVWFFAF